MASGDVPIGQTPLDCVGRPSDNTALRPRVVRAIRHSSANTRCRLLDRRLEILTHFPQVLNNPLNVSRMALIPERNVRQITRGGILFDA